MIIKYEGKSSIVSISGLSLSGSNIFRPISHISQNKMSDFNAKQRRNHQKVMNKLDVLNFNKLDAIVQDSLPTFRTKFYANVSNKWNRKEKLASYIMLSFGEAKCVIWQKLANTESDVNQTVHQTCNDMNNWTLAADTRFLV